MTVVANLLRVKKFRDPEILKQISESKGSRKVLRAVKTIVHKPYGSQSPKLTNYNITTQHLRNEVVAFL